jgi:DNA-binding MarR family transcriptional regulator
MSTFPKAQRRRNRKNRLRKAASVRGRRSAGKLVSHPLPSTVSRKALLERGSDCRFRHLVHDLFTIGARMERVRNYLGRQLGLSGPQYTVMMAVAHLQGRELVSVRAVASALHVSSAFIAAETGKLVRLGLLSKEPNPADRRGVVLALSPRAQAAIERLTAKIRAINDQFFGKLDRAEFLGLSTAIQHLVSGSEETLRFINAIDDDVVQMLDAAE